MNTSGDSTNIEQLKEVKTLCYKKAKGSLLSNLFLSIVVSKNYTSFTASLKKFDKLLQIDAPASIIRNLHTQHTLIKPDLTSSILFGKNIYERMLYYNHKLNHRDGKPLFKYTKKEKLSDVDIQGFDWKKAKAIEFKSDEDNGGFKRIPIQDGKISDADLQNILKKDQDAEIIYTEQDVTVEDLIREGVIKEENKTFSLPPDFVYTDEGFVKRSDHNWTTLKPTNHTTTPPQYHQLELVVYSRGDMPGIFSDQGHASIKLTTPNGEVYDVGLNLDRWQKWR